MNLTRCLMALILMLDCSTVAWANGAPPEIIWDKDPGYTQARIASTLAPWLPSVLFILALVWAVRRRLFFGIFCVLFFGFPIVMWEIQETPQGFTTIFLKEGEPPPLGTVNEAGEYVGRPPGSPRPWIPEEVLVVCCFVYALVVVAGMRFARRIAASNAPKPLPKTSGKI